MAITDSMIETWQVGAKCNRVPALHANLEDAMSDQIVREFLRKLIETFGLPRSDAEFNAFRQAARWLSRPSLWQGETPYWIAELMETRARIMAAMRSSEALRLGGWINRSSGAASSVPRFIAQIARAAVRLAGRHPLALIFLLALVTATAAYAYSHRAAQPPQVASVPSCDCTRVSGGLLTKEWQTECRNGETVLKIATKTCGGDLSCIREKLALKSGPDGTLVSGSFCGAQVGPSAWPVREGPSNPPPQPPDLKPCLKVHGLARECDEE
jgi:hypothetical protein